MVQSPLQDWRQLQLMGPVPHLLSAHRMICAPPSWRTQIWPAAQVSIPLAHENVPHGPVSTVHCPFGQCATVRPAPPQSS
jgi:hypothetical protein